MFTHNSKIVMLPEICHISIIDANYIYKYHRIEIYNSDGSHGSVPRLWRFIFLGSGSVFKNRT